MSNLLKIGDIVIRTGGFQSEIQTGTRCEVLRVIEDQICVKVLDAHLAGVPDDWSYIADNFALDTTPRKDEAL